MILVARALGFVLKRGDDYYAEDCGRADPPDRDD